MAYHLRSSIARALPRNMSTNRKPRVLALGLHSFVEEDYLEEFKKEVDLQVISS